MIEKEPTNTPAPEELLCDNGFPDSELDQENFIKVRQCDDINQKYKRQAIFENIKPESIFDLKFVQTWSKMRGFVRFSFAFAEKSSEDEYAFLVAEFKSNIKHPRKSYRNIAMMFPLEEVETLNLPQFNSFDYYPQKE